MRNCGERSVKHAIGILNGRAAINVRRRANDGRNLFKRNTFGEKRFLGAARGRPIGIERRELRRINRMSRASFGRIAVCVSHKLKIAWSNIIQTAASGGYGEIAAPWMHPLQTHSRALRLRPRFYYDFLDTKNRSDIDSHGEHVRFFMHLAKGSGWHAAASRRDSSGRGFDSRAAEDSARPFDDSRKAGTLDACLSRMDPRRASAFRPAHRNGRTENHGEWKDASLASRSRRYVCAPSGCPVRGDVARCELRLSPLAEHRRLFSRSVGDGVSGCGELESAGALSQG